jgi:outer membrane protein assembly factor BamB
MRLRLGVLLLAASLAGCAGQAAPRGSVAGSDSAATGSAGPATSSFNGSVATYRGDPARTGVMRGPGPSGSPTIAWQFRAAGPFQSSPAVVDGVVYAVSGDGVVHALDLSSGQERWNANLGAEASASLLVVGKLVIAADEEGIIHALSLADGTATWTLRTDGPISGSPAVVDDRIVAATQKGTVYSFDAASGRIAWQTAAGGEISRSVATADGTIYVGLGGEIVAISASEGSLLWRATVAADGAVGTPTVAGGVVFAATGLDADDAAAHAVGTVDAGTGKLGWRYASPTNAQIYTPAIAGGRAYVVGHDRLVVALDVASGDVVWSVERPSEIEALPAIVGNVVYVVGNDGPVEAIDATTGAPLWSVPIKGIPYAPTVVDGYLIVGTDVGTLYAIGGSR